MVHKQMVFVEKDKVVQTVRSVTSFVALLCDVNFLGPTNGCFPVGNLNCHCHERRFCLDYY